MGKIAVLGLGLVGLPVAIAFGEKRPVLGFDSDPQRIRDLRNGCDSTHRVCSREIAGASQLAFSDAPEDLNKCAIFIVTSSASIDSSKPSDLSRLIKASETVGEVLKPGDVVIYESTVFPGGTEEVCVPVLERLSGLKFNEDFYLGYSPERVNPGDPGLNWTDVIKVTSGSTPAIAAEVDALYAEVVTAGTFMASSIKVAEAIKVIENIRRDRNVPVTNELLMILSRLGIDTQEVLEAAGTKEGFHCFKPGQTNGHGLDVDPYHLINTA